MRGREFALWAVAAFCSVLLHGLFVWGGQTRIGVEEPEPQPATVTRVSFRSVAAPTPPQVPAQPVESEPEPEPEPPEPEPQPESEPEPPPEPPKPEPKPAAEPKPVARKVAAPEPPRPEPAPPAVAESAPAPQPPKPAPAARPDPARVEQARNEYMRRLLAHIEAHKRYPRVARRRRIEGRVEVSFALTAQGVRGLQAAGAASALERAAVEAVRSAEPLPRPPALLALPLQVSFAMVFALH